MSEPDRAIVSFATFLEYRGRRTRPPVIVAAQPPPDVAVVLPPPPDLYATAVASDILGVRRV